MTIMKSPVIRGMNRYAKKESERDRILTDEEIWECGMLPGKWIPSVASSASPC